jgi:hypothetical protein
MAREYGHPAGFCTHSQIKSSSPGPQGSGDPIWQQEEKMGRPHKAGDDDFV